MCRGGGCCCCCSCSDVQLNPTPASTDSARLSSAWHSTAVVCRSLSLLPVVTPPRRLLRSRSLRPVHMPPALQHCSAAPPLYQCSLLGRHHRPARSRGPKFARSPAANRHRPAPPATEGDGGCVGPGGCAAAASDRRTAAPVRPSARRVVAPRAGRLHPQQPLRRHLARVTRHLPPSPHPHPLGSCSTKLVYDTIRYEMLF